MSRLIYERVSSADKGDRARFETSSRSPKSWYLVRSTSRSERSRPEWAWGLPDVDHWALLFGKRGGVYAVTAEKSYPGPEYDVWLYRVGGTDLGDRTRLTGFQVDEATERRPDYLSDYLPDEYQVRTWPDV